MKVKESDLIGKIQKFPIEVVQRMCECQVEQGNKFDPNVFSRDICAGKYEGGFNWDLSCEGDDFWSIVILGKKFNIFFEKYPRVTEDNTGLEVPEEVPSLEITPSALANGYFAGEGVSQEIKDAWAKGYEYANRLLTEDGPQPSTNEGIKDGVNKVDYSEINFEILDLMAARFEANKHKYPKGNMLKPIEMSKLLWPIFRHWKKMIFPLKDDPETFEEHLAAIACNCSMILDQLKLK